MFNDDGNPGIAISPTGQVAILWECDIEGQTNLMMLLSESSADVDSWMLMR